MNKIGLHYAYWIGTEAVDAGAYKWMELSDEMYANTIEATKRCLSLPMHPYLKEEDVDLICQALLDS